MRVPDEYFFIGLILSVCILSGCTSSPAINSTYTGLFYSDRYFMDARELFDEQLAPKPNFEDEIYTYVDFKHTDKIIVQFDPKRFIEDKTGRIPGNQKLYYDLGSTAHRVTISMDVPKVEVVELIDLQAKSGCLDHQPHETNLGVARFDPSINAQSVTFSIGMPCRRYYSMPEEPFESLLMVKVKTSDGYYYTKHRLYSATYKGCFRLWCGKGEYEHDNY